MQSTYIFCTHNPLFLETEEEILSAHLDAKLNKLQEKNEEIQKRSELNEMQNKVNFLNTVTKFLKKRVAYEDELSKRNKYPYETTTSPEQVYN